MSYYDLQDLKQRIQRVGNKIREQETFCGDINEFLQQVYHAEQGIKRKRRLHSDFVSY